MSYLHRLAPQSGGTHACDEKMTLPESLALSVIVCVRVIERTIKSRPATLHGLLFEHDGDT
ncbi:hypothetical protein PC120_g27158 [Phytophthora cactorum]|nr:hypothetical protein PC120_g27158 [Phytophthora cactorum]